MNTAWQLSRTNIIGNPLRPEFTNKSSSTTNRVLLSQFSTCGVDDDDNYNLFSGGQIKWM